MSAKTKCKPYIHEITPEFIEARCGNAVFFIDTAMNISKSISDDSVITPSEDDLIELSLLVNRVYAERLEVTTTRKFNTGT